MPWATPSTVSQSYSYPGSFQWANIDNIKVDDSNYAECRFNMPATTPAFTYYLIAQDFQWDEEIPSDAEVYGFRVRIKFKDLRVIDGGIVTDFCMQLIVNGSRVGQNKATSAEWPKDAWELKQFGASDDLWALVQGTDFTVADLKAPGFGVAIGAQLDGDEGIYVGAGVQYVDMIIDSDK